MLHTLKKSFFVVEPSPWFNITIVLNGLKWLEMDKRNSVKIPFENIIFSKKILTATCALKDR